MEQLSRIYTGKPLTDAEIKSVAPSVFAATPFKRMSSQYQMVPSAAIINGLRSEGFLPYSAQQSKSRIEGKHDFTKHLIRLRREGDISPRTKGQEFNEILFINSHDGSSTYEMFAGRFRLVCLNGMVAGSNSVHISIPHKGSDVIHNVIEGATRVLDQFDQIDEAWERFKRTILLPDEAEAFAQGALNLKYEERAPIEAATLLSRTRIEDNATDLWTTFNVVQEHLMRGGIRGRAVTGRGMMTRPVSGIDTEVNLNRRLWDFADVVARMKSGEAA